MAAPSDDVGISFDDVACRPYPGLNYIVGCGFCTDGELLAYLHSDGGLDRTLVAYDLRTKTASQVLDGKDSEETLSLEEQLERERRRQLSAGVTSFKWVTDATKHQMVVPQGGNLYLVSPDTKALMCVFDRKSTGLSGPAMTPKVSPDGKLLGFVQDGEVYVVSLEAPGPAVQVTKGARGAGRTNGLASFIEQEELDRYEGFWWSCDSKRICYEEVDDSHIASYRIMHQGKPTTGEGAQEDHRYPFAGKDNPHVRLAVVDVCLEEGKASEPTWLDLGDEKDIYVPRVGWMDDGTMWVQILNRDQTQLDLVRYDPATSNKGHTVLTEKDECWLNVHDMCKPLDGNKLLWASERTGFMHLYLYQLPAVDDLDGESKLVAPVTSGDWEVNRIVGVDADAKQVYFMGRAEGPLEIHLYRVPLPEGASPEVPAHERLTKEPGVHSCTLNPSMTSFVDTFSSVVNPPKVVLRSLDATKEGDVTLWDVSEEKEVEESKSSAQKVKCSALVPPRLVDFKSPGGQTLYGALYLPDKEVHGDGPYPTLISVYGGTHVQRVTNAWSVTADLRAQRMAKEGYAVLKVDNRGSFHRGHAFETTLHKHMGTVEVEDQVAGVKWLVDQGIADKNRVGIYGWSYGGYMTLMCLAKAPDVFHAGVSGAPVSSWDGYDTCYTERYMSTPQKNPDGYEDSSVMTHIGGLKGKLMIVHGLIDENVHFRHTARLINAMIASRIPYDLMLLPDDRHTPRKVEDRAYMELRMAAYFNEHVAKRSV